MSPVIIKECEDLANNVGIEYEEIFGTKAKQMKAIQLLATTLWWRQERDWLIVSTMLTSAPPRRDRYIYYIYNYYWNKYIQ
jgi:hypothetical protein